METNVLTGDKLIEELPLGRRVADILADKGISPYELSRRLSWGKDSVYQSLEGKRYIKPSELALISEKIRVSVSRIKQEDTKDKAIELRFLIKSRKATGRAVEIGKSLLSIAVGWTEKFDVLNDLGSAYFFLNDYEEAHRYWSQALPYAEKIRDKFGEAERLYIITTNLVISYRMKKDYSTVSQLLKRVEQNFADFSPRHAGMLCFSQAIMASNMGDDHYANQKLVESLEHFKATLDDLLIGKGLHNLAYHKFLTKDFDSAKDLYDQAIRTLIKHPVPRLISMVDCIKVLIIKKETEAALRMVQWALKSADLDTEPELKAKFELLLSVVTNDPGYAERLVLSERTNKRVLLIACKFLLRYYGERDDAHSVLRYYKIAESIDESASIEWEEL